MNLSQLKRQLDQNWYGLAFFFVLAVALALDQWTKWLVSGRMVLGETVRLPVEFVQITFVRNFGGAFGVLEGSQILFFAASLMAVGCVYWQFPLICARAGMPGCALSAMITAGALGNMCDRIRLGYVVDMIDLKWWPVFNVADICITVGITVMIIWVSRMEFSGGDKELPVSDDADGINNEANE